MLVQVTLEPGGKKLRTHPWPKKKVQAAPAGSRRQRRKTGVWPGTWWTPGVGRVRLGERCRYYGDPHRVYLLPATDNGMAWWSDDRVVTFDDLGELALWIGEHFVAWREPPSRRRKVS